MIVDGGRQAQAGEHLRTPAVTRVLSECFENPRCRALLNLLHDLAGGGSGLGPDQQVKVVRHQNPADPSEVKLGPDGLEGRHECAAKSRAQKERRTAASARGDKLQLARGEIARTRHTWSEYNPRELSRIADLKVRATSSGCQFSVSPPLG